MPPVTPEVNTVADESPPKDRSRLSPSERSAAALDAFGYELEAYREAVVFLPATRAGLDRDLTAWWRRARGLALDVGALLPPMPPGAPVTRDAHAEYLDRLHGWAAGATAAEDRLAALNDRLLYAEAAIAHLADRLDGAPGAAPDPSAPRLFVPESEVPW